MASHRPSSALRSDLYELTMAAGYLETGLAATATFELFARHLPERRNYLVVGGIEQALEFLETARFSSEEIDYLRQLDVFRNVGRAFFDYLAEFRFSGDLWAMPEGTIFFPGEPVLRVTAPIAEAQIVETGLLAIIHFQTLISSKAARVSSSATGRSVVEFGSRRAHGIEAAAYAARAAYIAGCDGTSNTFAGHRFGIPVYGTQAHSWIMAHEDETDAFRDFLAIYPENAILLLDTYDVRTAFGRMLDLGIRPRGVRLDSGDLCADSIWMRQKLDAAGWNDVQIFASGDLDEDRIAELLRSGAQIDAFGVGTALSTSSDVPNLPLVYKLAELEVDGQVRRAAKLTEAKETYPGRKQVFRFGGGHEEYSWDVIGLSDEHFLGAEPLLLPALRNGRRLAPFDVSPAEAVVDARRRFLDARKHLPERLRALRPAHPAYPVRFSNGLEELLDDMRQSLVKSTATS
jgi:nicotinate phosphoribosyltransferase